MIVILQGAGINLTSLTVLAGVVGIGFGFGLQNLASNFINGITMLFEQQIRDRLILQSIKQSNNQTS